MIYFVRTSVCREYMHFSREFTKHKIVMHQMKRLSNLTFHKKNSTSWHRPLSTVNRRMIISKVCHISYRWWQYRHYRLNIAVFHLHFSMKCTESSVIILFMCKLRVRKWNCLGSEKGTEVIIRCMTTSNVRQKMSDKYHPLRRSTIFRLSLIINFVHLQGLFAFLFSNIFYIFFYIFLQWNDLSTETKKLQ